MLRRRPAGASHGRPPGRLGHPGCLPPRGEGDQDGPAGSRRRGRALTCEIGAGLMVGVSDNWRDAADRIRPRPPPGTLSLSELAREMGLSDELVTRIRL